MREEEDQHLMDEEAGGPTPGDLRVGSPLLNE